MGNKRNSFREYVMKFSFQERRKAELENFRNELARFRAMDEEEMNFEYIKEKINYEYLWVKFVLLLGILLIAFLYSIIQNNSLMRMVFQYMNTMENNSLEVLMVVGSIVVSVIAFFVFFFLFIIRGFLHNLKRSRKNIMVMEAIINRKDQDSI